MTKQKHLSDPLDCMIEWCESNDEIKEKYPLIVNNAKDELKRLREKVASNESKIGQFFKLDTEERVSFQEFKNMVEINFVKHGQRYGQTTMNVLGEVRPERYREITGTNLDCFHDDKKTNYLLGYLERGWNS